MMRLSSGKFEIFLPTLVLLLYVYQAYPVHSSILNPISSSRINKQSNTGKFSALASLVFGKFEKNQSSLECSQFPPFHLWELDVFKIT